MHTIHTHTHKTQRAGVRGDGSLAASSAFAACAIPTLLDATTIAVALLVTVQV